MSLYGALYSGVSGLSAESSAMSAISDNITNVNTIGYKETDVNFKTLVTKQVSSSQYSPGGVQAAPQSQIGTQGLLQSTSASTDVAISGSGFFIVNSSATPGTTNSGMFAYTRAGQFTVDKSGYLENTSGYYLQGWPLMNYDGTSTASHEVINGTDFMKAYKGSTGSTVYINDSSQPNSTDLQSLNLDDIAGTASPTTSIRTGANLPSGDAVGTSHETDSLEYDSLGNSHDVVMTWTKAGGNAWSLQTLPPEGSQSVTMLDQSGGIYSSTGRLDFSSTPASGQFSMTMDGGTTWNFITGAGTNGSSTNTMFAAPSAGESTATYATTVAGLMNTAYLVTYCGYTATTAATGAPAVATPSAAAITAADGDAANTDTLTLGGTTVDLSGSTTLAAAVTTINGKTSVTGVQAFNNNGVLELYSANQGTIAVSGSGIWSGFAGNVVGTGYTYASNVAGSGSLTFSNFDSTIGHTVTLNGLTSLLTGTPPSSTAFGAATVTTSDTLHISGPLSGTTSTAITLTAGETLSSVAAAINAQIGNTGVGAYVSGTNIDYYTSTPGNVTLSFTGGTLPNQTFTNTGTKALEQAYAPTANNPDSIALQPIAATVVSATGTGTSTSSTTELGPNTTAIGFNGDGTPSAINVASMQIAWANGSENQVGQSSTTVPAVGLYFGDIGQSDGMTQLSGSYALSYQTQNGAKFGNFSGVSIGSDGVVTANFDNGVTRPIFQIPIASFVDPDGMESLSGNVFIGTDTSGDPTLRTPGTVGAGSVNQSSLESSTVDIGTQFTTMIVTQRAYSAASKIITTANQMLDDLMSIVR